MDVRESVVDNRSKYFPVKCSFREGAKLGPYLEEKAEKWDTKGVISARIELLKTYVRENASEKISMAKVKTFIRNYEQQLSSLKQHTHMYMF